MSLLLDTHALIWYLEKSDELPERNKKLIEQQGRLFVSIVSMWEIAIKVRIGKLLLKAPLAQIEEKLLQYRVSIIPISLSDIIKTTELEIHHQDPFDRMIIAQSINNNFPILSKDEQFDAYGIQRIW